MSQGARSNWRWFLVLLGLQAVGAVIIMVNGVPIYRKLLAKVPRPAADDRSLAVAVLAVILIQAAFWMRRRACPLPTVRQRALAGHLVLFCSRLAFVFATSLFSTIFFARFAELDASALRIAVLLGVLYSMFCFTSELELIGRAMQDGHALESAAPASQAPPPQG